MGAVIFPPHLAERRLHVTRDAIRLYADISHDYNPIHLDAEFAAKTPMGGVIAHGMLSLSLVWQSLAQTLGPERMGGIALQVRFVRPVREGDWVIAGGALGDEPGTYEVWVRAESDTRTETAIVGTAVLAEEP
jgi:3-hydroxybutyryl-CoA dehydratase